MRILILSRIRNSYANRRIVEEAEKLGHTVNIISPLKCVISLVNNAAGVIYAGKLLHRKKGNGTETHSIPSGTVLGPQTHDVVIPRVGTQFVPYSLAILRQLRMSGLPLLNDDEAISRAKNKLRCLQHLAQNGIKIPPTLIAKSPEVLEKLMDRVGGPPVVLKMLGGTHGTGVILSESRQSALSSFEAFAALGQDMILQKFVEESRGQDIRAFVVGNRVVGAMKRIVTSPDEFRSNIHRGADAEHIVRLPPDYEKIAIRASKVTRLMVCGVDIIETSEGPMVLEVNASPGFEGLEAATNLNIAQAIVKMAEKLARKSKAK